MRAAIIATMAVLGLAFLIGMALARPAGGRGCPASMEPPVHTLLGAASYDYKTASGRALRLHVFAPPGDAARRPAVIFYFGGGWRIGGVKAFEPQARALTSQGMVTILADYRIRCRDKTSPADAVADAKDSYAWVLDHAGKLGVDPSRIVLAGGSAGGHLALATDLLTPRKPRPAALALFNPLVDTASIAPFVGLTPEEGRAISPSLLSLDRLPPTIIFHGRADRTVAIQTVRDFCARAQAAGRRCDVVEYEGQGHAFFNSREIDPAVGASPYDDTLARMIVFLRSRGLAN